MPSRQSEGILGVETHPEARLLLYISRTHLDATTVEKINTLLHYETINWAHLMELATQHGVIALLHSNLTHLCPDLIPSAIRQQLQQRYETQSLRNLFLTGELWQLLDCLKQHGISAIPFKGPVLSAMTYGSITLRQFCDLDILVHEKDFYKTRELLLSQGYDPVVQPWFLDEAQETAYLESRNEYTLLRQDKLVSIDLHRRLAAGDFFLIPLDFERLWEFDQVSQRLQTILVAGKPIASLPVEDVLLFLCVHGSKHLWTRLAWICDVAELMRSHPNLNWDWVFKQADRVGCDRMLSVGLLLASDLLGATLPTNVRQRVEANSHSKLLVAQVQKWLFRQTGAPVKGFSFERVGFHIHEIKPLQGKMKYCYRSLGHYGLAPVRRAITPSFKDRSFFQLPLVLSPLYYLVRPIRLIRDLGWVLWKYRLKL